MKTPSSILILTLAISTWAAADLPKKAPYSKYLHLVQNSPFTSKPLPVDPGPQVNILDDYALAGVSPIAGGYRVTLLNKKKPDERIAVSSDEVKPKHGFKILEVMHKEGDPLGTTVKLSSASGTGTVAFDEKHLALAAPAAPKQAPNGQHPNAQHPSGLPAAMPGIPGQTVQPGQIPGRQPRPRVVPPPTPAGGNQATPFQPGGQQPASGGNNRFDRRGGGHR